MRSRSYVIVSRPDRGGRVRAPLRHGGRHRCGVPGRVRRYPPGATAPRGRHRRTRKPSALAARYGTLVVLFGTVAVSGWFAATGAAAVAQMIQP